MKSVIYRLVYRVFAIGLAAGLLYWALRGIEWPRVWRILVSGRLSPVVLGCLIMTANLFLRAVRWRLLLSTAGTVPIPTAFWATSAGYLGNSFLPARAGELIRTLMISRRTGMSKTFVLTTALSERIFDAIALLVITAWVLLVLPARPGWIEQATRPLAFVALACLLAVIVVPRLESVLKRVAGRIGGSQRLRETVAVTLEQILLAMRSLHSPARLVSYLGLTAIIWVTDGGTAVIVAHALGLPMALPVAFLLIAALGLSSALPSTPGYVGVYQFVAVTILPPFDIRKNQAIAYILLYQAMQYVIVTFWGLLAVWRSRQERQTQTAPVPNAQGIPSGSAE